MAASKPTPPAKPPMIFNGILVGEESLVSGVADGISTGSEGRAGNTWKLVEPNGVNGSLF